MKSSEQHPAFSQQTKLLSKISLGNFVRLVKDGPKDTKQSRSPIERLQALGIGTPLIVVSQEQFRIRRFVEWLQETLFDSSPPSPNKVSPNKGSFWGSQMKTSASIQPLITSFRNLSFFQDGELLVLFEAEKLQIALSRKLIEIFRKGSSSALVVLILNSWEKKNMFLSELGEISTVIEVEELQGNELVRWVEREAVRAGTKSGITPDAVRLLLQAYGNNLSQLSAELGKLSLLSEGENPIGQALVKEMALKAPDATSFELITHIAHKRVKEAVALTEALLHQGLHPLQVNAFLSRSFRTLLFQKNLRVPATKTTLIKQSTSNKKDSSSNNQNKGTKKDGEEKKSGELTNPWFVRKLQHLLPIFSRGDLLHSVEVLKELDRKIKSSKFPDELLLSLAVQELAMRYT